MRHQTFRLKHPDLLDTVEELRPRDALLAELLGNADDAKRKFNRTENLRPIPPDDPDFDRLYARRNDAESINRHLDDTLWLGRAHSIGRHRQGLNLLTYALCVNGLALHLHRRRRQPVPA